MLGIIISCYLLRFCAVHYKKTGSLGMVERVACGQNVREERGRRVRAEYVPASAVLLVVHAGELKGRLAVSDWGPPGRRHNRTSMHVVCCILYVSRYRLKTTSQRMCICKYIYNTRYVHFFIPVCSADVYMPEVSYILLVHRDCCCY